MLFAEALADEALAEAGALAGAGALVVGHVAGAVVLAEDVAKVRVLVRDVADALAGAIDVALAAVCGGGTLPRAGVACGRAAPWLNDQA